MAGNRIKFDRLLQDYALDRLVQQRDALNAQVPESMDRAAEAAFQKMGAMAAAGAYTGIPKIGAGLAAVKAAVISVTAAAVLIAGSCALVPVIRSAVDRAAIEETAKAKAPADYEIPSPGDDFTVTDEASSERIAARWFKSDHQQVMVQIAYSLPDSSLVGQEYAAVCGIPAAVTETDDTQILTIQHGDVFIQIQYFNAERAELIAYAERLISMNGGNSK